MATDLSFRDRSNPSKNQIHTNDHGTHDPDSLWIILSTLRSQVEAEHKRKDDTTKVTTRASEAGHNTIVGREDVWHVGEVQTIGTIHEERHGSHETEHCAVVVGVELADDDEESTGDGDVGVEEDAL